MLVSCIGSVLLPHYFDWNTEQSMTLRLVTALVLSVVSIRLCGIFPRKVLSLNRGEQFLYIWLTAIGCLCLLSGQPSAEPLFSAGLIGSLFLLLKYCLTKRRSAGCLFRWSPPGLLRSRLRTVTKQIRSGSAGALR